MVRILLVDDNPAIRQLLKDALRDEAYEIVEASDGEAAIAYLTDHPVDLVVLDVDMPVTDGFETLRVIKDPFNGWPDTKVLMLTVHKEPESVLKAWGIGAEVYCTKPFLVAEVVAKIHDLLGDRRETP